VDSPLALAHALALGVASVIFALLAVSRPTTSPGGPIGRTWGGGLVAAGGLLVGPALISGLVLVLTMPGGVPALVGTRHGRLLLLQSVLLGVSLILLAAVARRISRPDPGGLRGLLAIEAALGLGMTLVATRLAVLPAAAPEPLIWPFHFRLAPGVMWRAPSVQGQVIVGAEIVVGGILALAMAYRMRGWRPLLVAAGVGLSVLGVYKALSALTLDAYPTTYARPVVAPTPESIRHGRELFAAHCAACHGATGRGDGPAAAGLLQRPADLTASHTADHTPGDIFWWLTHGLGLAMPAFGDQLSTEERWHLVNFVRSLSVPAAAGSGRGR
jgi:putative copper resistance protein D